MSSTVTVNRQDSIDRIDEHVYGHFAEHLGRCIYGGLWVGEDDDRVPTQDGIRMDTVELLKELDIPVLRWPGGCFADDYHWEDGVGPVEDRPVVPIVNWGGLEPNYVGTNEWLRFCELADVEPYLTVPFWSVTGPEEAAKWVEYVNGSTDTEMGALRTEHGYPEPWDVTWWGIGNEVWGDFQVGNTDAKSYAEEYEAYHDAMRAVDPDSRLDASAMDPWLRTVHDGSYVDRHEGEQPVWNDILFEHAPDELEGSTSTAIRGAFSMARATARPGSRTTTRIRSATTRSWSTSRPPGRGFSPIFGNSRPTTATRTSGSPPVSGRLARASRTTGRRRPSTRWPGRPTPRGPSRRSSITARRSGSPTGLTSRCSPTRTPTGITRHIPAPRPESLRRSVARARRRLSPDRDDRFGQSDPSTSRNGRLDARN